MVVFIFLSFLIFFFQCLRPSVYGVAFCALFNLSFFNFRHFPKQTKK